MGVALNRKFVQSNGMYDLSIKFDEVVLFKNLSSESWQYLEDSYISIFALMYTRNRRAWNVF